MPFGKTGHVSTRILFGAAAFGSVTQEEADQTMELLLASGINHIDTAASYGESELRLGPWMQRCRESFFLATKTADRTHQKAKDSLHRSLERLRVDHVDLLQLHALITREEWEVAMGPGGALEAAMEARDAGLVRFIGVTGHGPEISRRHIESLERFAFDSVLLPYSHLQMQHADYAREFEEVLNICRQRNVALQTIKSTACRRWNQDHHTSATWYEPLTEQADINKAVHWVLGQPEVFLNTPGDIHVLPRVLAAAACFESRPTDKDMQELIEQRSMCALFE